MSAFAEQALSLAIACMENGANGAGKQMGGLEGSLQNFLSRFRVSNSRLMRPSARL
jgi:hypothetical protein